MPPTQWQKSGNSTSSTSAGEDDDDPALKYFELDTPPEGVKLGMRFVGTEIVKVVPGSWAAKSGVELDDEIWEVNGKPFRGLSDEEKRQLFDKKRPFTINFKRPLYRDDYFEAECDDYNLGLEYIKDTIVIVHRNSWGARSGVKIGDKLQELEDRNIKTLSDSEILDIVKNPKRPLSLQFKRPHARHVDQEALQLTSILSARVSLNPDERKDGVAAMAGKGSFGQVVACALLFFFSPQLALAALLLMAFFGRRAG